MEDYPIREVGGRRHRQHEQGGFAELWFEGLQVGDVILLETESGSSYQLEVRHSDDPAKQVVSVERANRRREVTGDDRTTWESVTPDTLFDLRGSCERVLTGVSTGIQVVGGTTEHFVVGKRAWLGAEVEGEDKTLVTSRLTSINLIPAV